MNKKQITEIKWNLINSGLIGLVSATSASIATGEISFKSIGIGIITGLGVAAVKFNEYWKTKKPSRLFNLIH